MKTLYWIAWISIAAAVMIMIAGAISIVSRQVLFGFNQSVNFFHTANPFLLLAISLFMVTTNNKSRTEK